MELWSANAENEQIFEAELGGDGIEVPTDYLAELEEMQCEINSTIGALKEQMKRLEGEQKVRKKLNWLNLFLLV